VKKVLRTLTPISLGNSTVNTKKTRNHSIFPLFLGIKVYLYPIFRDKREVFWAEVITKSRLSKNQWELTVRKDYRFLLDLDLILSSSRKSKFISSFSILNSRVIRQMELKPSPDFTLSSSSLLPRYYLPFPDFTVKDQYSRFILVHSQSIRKMNETELSVNPQHSFSDPLDEWNSQHSRRINSRSLSVNPHSSFFLFLWSSRLMRVNSQSILSKNQWSFTVRKDYGRINST